MHHAGGGDDIQGKRPVHRCQGFYVTQKGFPDCVIFRAPLQHETVQCSSSSFQNLWLYRKVPFSPDEPYMVSNKWELKTDLYKQWTLQMIQTQQHSNDPWQKMSCWVCVAMLQPLRRKWWILELMLQTASKNPDCWWCGYSFLVWPGPGVTKLQAFIFV